MNLPYDSEYCKLTKNQLKVYYSECKDKSLQQIIKEIIESKVLDGLGLDQKLISECKTKLIMEYIEVYNRLNNM